MTPEQQAFLDALTFFFNDDVMVQLPTYFPSALAQQPALPLSSRQL
jgi:hypothetical protein